MCLCSRLYYWIFRKKSYKERREAWLKENMQYGIDSDL